MNPGEANEPQSSTDSGTSDIRQIWNRAIYCLTYPQIGEDEEFGNFIKNTTGFEHRPRNWEREASRLFLGPRISKHFTSAAEGEPESIGFIAGMFLSLAPHSTDELAKEMEKVGLDSDDIATSILSVLGIPSILISGDIPKIRKALKGIQSGLTSIIDEDENLSISNSTTIIYMSILLNADKMERYDSVREFYDLLKNHFGEGLPHDFESFKKICHRIGFRGSKFEARKN